jgi:predicted RNA-binding protein with PIN domain
VNLLVDGNNVIGARPDGWWRDPAAAALRLLGRLQCYATTHDGAVAAVFDVARPELPAGEHGGVIVEYATRRGRDAADDRIRELLAADPGAAIEVITSDRALAADARAAGARVTGAGAFLARLDAAGC